MRRGSGRSGRKIDYRKNKKGHKILKRLAYKYEISRRSQIAGSARGGPASGWRRSFKNDKRDSSLRSESLSPECSEGRQSEAGNER